VVLKENVEDTMDSKESLQGGVADVRHKKRSPNNGFLARVLRRDGVESTCLLRVIEGREPEEDKGSPTWMELEKQQILER